MTKEVVKCLRTDPHNPHDWREGFLWHRKRKCDGLSYSDSDRWASMGMGKPHRHFYRVWYGNSVYISWKCLDCGEVVSMLRNLYNEEALGEQPGACGKLDKDCTC